MKKQYFLLLGFIGILSAATAQISFTSANAPKVGTSVRNRSSSEDSLFNFKTGLAGANRVWNFASFKFDTTQAIDQVNFINPKRTVYGNNPLIAGATYASFDVTTPENITFDSISTTNWWHIASADSAGLQRTDPIARELSFPWTYNSAFRDSSVQVVVDATSGDTIRVRNLTTAKCDAYGSITTSIGTLNCLRTLRTAKIEIELFPGFGLYLSVISTEWWTTQHPQPVFSHTRLNLDILGNVDSICVVNSLVQTRVANEEIAKTDLKTYPNPAQSIVNLDFDSAENQKIALTVFNLSGQVMHLEHFDALQGKQQRTLDVSNLPNGLYVVHLAGEKNKNLGMRKIIVQHQ